MSKHKHEWIFAVRSGAALKASDAFICNVPGCGSAFTACPVPGAPHKPAGALR